MLTRMTRMARMLTHMLTRMTRWLAGSHIIHTHQSYSEHPLGNCLLLTPPPSPLKFRCPSWGGGMHIFWKYTIE